MTPETKEKSEEKIGFSLRSLYGSYGYLPYKMNQFEEYAFYLENRDFLVNDRVITFTDTTGRLLALKPDVTLSILKHHAPETGVKQKMCYNETVYRVSGASGEFRELMQAGLEALGDLDGYDMFEAVSLAAESLRTAGGAYELDLSHLGILDALFDEAGADEALRKTLLALFAEKNAHDLLRVCREAGVKEEAALALAKASGIYGERKKVLKALLPLCRSEKARAAWEELNELDGLLSRREDSDRIRYDFSVVNDMTYYDGVVFKGYLEGIPEGVLSGGCYDRLMKKMGKASRGVGFAVYLDLLEGRNEETREFDVDALVLYDPSTPVEKVAAAVRDLQAEGKSVSAQRAVPRGIRAAEVLDLRKEPVC